MKGIGTAKAVESHAACTLAKRLAVPGLKALPRLNEPGTVYGLLREDFRNVPQERFLALLLDTKNQLLRTEAVTIGLADRTQIHPREVFRPAVRESCSRILLVHNHPSGDPAPSPQDVAATRQLVEAGKILGIEILNHIIIGDPAKEHRPPFISFRQEGLIGTTG